MILLERTFQDKPQTFQNNPSKIHKIALHDARWDLKLLLVGQAEKSIRCTNNLFYLEAKKQDPLLDSRLQKSDPTLKLLTLGSITTLAVFTSTSTNTVIYLYTYKNFITPWILFLKMLLMLFLIKYLYHVSEALHNSLDSLAFQSEVLTVIRSLKLCMIRAEWLHSFLL